MEFRQVLTVMSSTVCGQIVELTSLLKEKLHKYSISFQQKQVGLSLVLRQVFDGQESDSQTGVKHSVTSSTMGRPADARRQVRV